MSAPRAAPTPPPNPTQTPPIAHLDDAVHVGDEAVDADLQEHHQRSAHVLPHLGVLIHSQSKEVLRGGWGGGATMNTAFPPPRPAVPPRPSLTPPHLDEGVDVLHQRLSAVHDELIDAGDGVGPGGGRGGGTGRYGLIK